MRKIKALAAGLLIVMIIPVLAGCTGGAFSNKKLNKILKDHGAQSAGWETVVERATRLEALDGGYYAESIDNPKRAQDTYDNSIRRDEDPDCEVVDSTYFAESSTYGDRHFNSYIMMVTFKNDADAEAFYDNRFKSEMESGNKGSYKYSILYYKPGDIEMVNAVYKSGKTVMQIIASNPDSRENKVLPDLIKKIGVISPYDI